MGSLGRPRGSRGDRPGPFAINRSSPQARGLFDVFDGAVRPSYLRQVTPTVAGTFDGSTARPSPLLGPFQQNNQAGGNGLGLILDTTGLVNTDALTISMWAYQYQAAAAKRGLWLLGNDGAWSMGQSTSDDGVAGDVSVAVVTTSGGAARFTAGPSTALYTSRAWQLFTTVWNPGSGLSVYVNATLIASNATATNTIRAVDQLRIFGCGSIPDIGGGFATNGWDGSIADVRIYRRALSIAEVWALYEPSTRWDLYQVPSTRVYVDVPAAGGAFNPAWAVGSNRIYGGVTL